MNEDPPNSTDRPEVDLYDATYGRFATDLYRAIRARTYDDDIGQNGWLTAPEQDRFISWLQCGPEAELLDVACGSGGPALRIAAKTGCRITGVDIHEQGIANATASARGQGLEAKTRFEIVDADRPLPFPDGSFDAITCIDAVNHLPHRAEVLADWRRLLKPDGRLLFTDPIVVTGILTNEEIRIRSSIGIFLFAPAGEDERLLREAGLDVVRREDATDNMATVADRWRAARAERSDDLRRVEGNATFEGQQRFFEVTSRLAAERRLSRIAFLATRAR
jgi:SAM-dependent methyltransferase